MIRITAGRDSFRRCNIEFTRAPKDFPDDFFGKKDLEVLRNEPMLTVQENMPDEIAKTPDLKDMGPKELKLLCDRLEIEYPAKAGKNDLIELIEQKTAKPPKE